VEALFQILETEKLSSGVDISKFELTQYLELLAKDKVQMITKVTEGMGGGSYQISKAPILLLIYSISLELISPIPDIENFVTVIRQKIIESVIQDKFGPLALRVFRLLTIKKQLEEKKVQRLSFLFLVNRRRAC